VWGSNLEAVQCAAHALGCVKSSAESGKWVGLPLCSLANTGTLDSHSLGSAGGQCKHSSSRTLPMDDYRLCSPATCALRLATMIVRDWRPRAEETRPRGGRLGSAVAPASIHSTATGADVTGTTEQQAKDSVRGVRPQALRPQGAQAGLQSVARPPGVLTPYMGLYIWPHICHICHTISWAAISWKIPGEVGLS